MGHAPVSHSNVSVPRCIPPSKLKWGQRRSPARVVPIFWRNLEGDSRQRTDRRPLAVVGADPKGGASSGSTGDAVPVRSIRPCGRFSGPWIRGSARLHPEQPEIVTGYSTAKKTGFLSMLALCRQDCHAKTCGLYQPSGLQGRFPSVHTTGERTGL